MVAEVLVSVAAIRYGDYTIWEKNWQMHKGRLVVIHHSCFQVRIFVPFKSDFHSCNKRDYSQYHNHLFY